MLYSTHMMLATLVKTPELMLDESEAKMLASAVSNVTRHYDTGIVSQKTMDYISLVQACGLIYGPRIFAARNRKAMVQAQRAAQRQADMASGVPAGQQPAPQAGPDPETPFDGRPASVSIM